VTLAVAPTLSGARAAGGVVQAAQPAGMRQINLAAEFAAGKLKAVNRDVASLQGRADGVHVSEKAGPGVVWIGGTNFSQGTIELDVRGRDVFQQSFVGIAFHGKDDNTYEAVYVRPFNFRTTDRARHQHAVQYIALPEYDWPRLREQFPDEFEKSVDPSVAPSDWVPLRVVVNDRTIQAYIGRVTSPTLEVRKLGSQAQGLIGLWAGNTSDGDFANLRVTPK